jgi:hypothetical protein
MSHRLHLTRGAVAASVCVALALSTAGTAAALSSAEPAGAGSVPAVVAVAGRVQAAAVDARSAAAPAAARSTTGTTRATATVDRKQTTTKRASSTRTVTIRRYTDAPGSQRAIDACRLVLWTTRPLWLAGHNYCGYQWLAYVRTGTVVTVPSGRAAGRYVVTGHLRLTRQSGPMPVVRADLVLQTCIGRGTGLTLARRLR